jgi:hypothetical protein
MTTLPLPANVPAGRRAGPFICKAAQLINAGERHFSVSEIKKTAGIGKFCH